MAEQELEQLIADLHDQLNEVYRLDDQWKCRGEWPARETGSILPAPAAATDVRKLEKQLGRNFPPSYARFLGLHDGWKHFWMDFTLIGASREHSEHFLEKIRETIDWQTCTLKEDLGELTDARMKEWEAQHTRNLFLENHLIFGADFAGSLFVFDGRSRQANGEMLIRHWSIANGASNEEFFEEDYLGGPSAANFEEMLLGVTGQAAKYLNRLKKSKSRKKK